MKGLTAAEEKLAQLLRQICGTDQKDLAICIGLKARKENKVEELVKFAENNRINTPDTLVEYLYRNELKGLRNDQNQNNEGV